MTIFLFTITMNSQVETSWVSLGKWTMDPLTNSVQSGSSSIVLIAVYSVNQS